MSEDRNPGFVRAGAARIRRRWLLLGFLIGAGLMLGIGRARPAVAQGPGFGSGVPGYGGPNLPPSPTKPPDVTGEDIFSEWGAKLKRSWQRLTGKGPSEEVARQMFAEADELFRQGNYKKALSLYRKAASQWPDSPIEEDALLMQAECYFFLDQYPKANDLYENLLEEYENTRHLDIVMRRLFAIGRYWEQLQQEKPRWALVPNALDRTRPLFDTTGNALAAYESVRLHDPTGPLADDSIMATANIYFLRGRYEDADYYYTLLREQYPQSEHQAMAHVLGLRAKLRRYEGPQYDGTVLDEAEELIQTMLIQFPDQLAEERDRLLVAQQAVRAQKAEREWKMAEYYAKTKHYGAARYYYRLVVNEYPDTRFAELAQQRMVEFADKPDEPPQQFEWLVNLFERDETKKR